MSRHQQLALTDDLTIYHALDQKNALLDALAMCDVLELDLARVGEMDTAGLQLLVLLKKEAALAGKEVRLLAHSPAVRSVIELCNMAAEFGDPLLIPAQD